MLSLHTGAQHINSPGAFSYCLQRPFLASATSKLIAYTQYTAVKQQTFASSGCAVGLVWPHIVTVQLVDSRTQVNGMESADGSLYRRHSNFDYMHKPLEHGNTKHCRNSDTMRSKVIRQAHLQAQVL